MSRRDETHVSRDAAGVGPHVRGGTRLVSLSELDRMRIAEGEPDIRGWEISMLSGTVIGRVADLLVDPDAREVVMLDVDLAGTDRHSYAPIRAAQVDRARRRVIIDSAELHDMNDVPSLSRNEPLSDDDARRFSEGYARIYGDRGWSRDEQRDWRVRRGGEDLHFRRGAADLGAEAAAAAAAGDDTAVSDRDALSERERLAQLRGERADQRAAHPAHDGDLRYAARDEETARKPVVIEEVVVRRRVVNADSPEALQADGHAPAPRDLDRDGHRVDDRVRELRDDVRRNDVR